MKILLINNYFHRVGGTETYFFNLAKLLKQKGHEVIFFSMQSPHNAPSEFDKYFISYFPPLKELTLFQRIKALGRVFYSFEAKKKIRQLIKEEKPDIAHINNIWYETTHSIIQELKASQIPLVMTLHDYRMICPNHKLLVGGSLCFKCKGHKYYNAVVKRCMGNSLAKSMVVTIYNYINNVMLQTYKSIDKFISPSLFVLRKFKEAGFIDEDKLICLPNLLEANTSISDDQEVQEKSIVYFGRIDEEKGLDTLIEAVKGLEVTLKIIGTGPLENILRENVVAENISNVKFMGFLSKDEIKVEVKKSLFSVTPSRWFEVFSYTTAESFIWGKPVLASDIGALPELVKNGVTGYLFEAGNPSKLRDNIARLLNNRKLITEMGKQAKIWIDDHLKPDQYYKALIKVYEDLAESKIEKI